MNLNMNITVTPPPFTDNNNKVITPNPIVLNNLDVTYSDSPTHKTVTAVIKHIPSPITLLSGTTYISAGDYTQQQIEAKLREFLGDDPQSKLQSLFPKTLEQNPNGPGSILTGMISALGIKSTSTCSCRRHALEMNEKGPDWCEQNIDTIMSWLKEESAKRGLPFVETVARMMVNRAITKSRKFIETKK
jgi:hypothetical protein